MKSFICSLLGTALVFVATCTYAQPSIPVDLVTGRAQVSIPLTVISDGTLSVPISLAYKASGVKVSDGDSHAGLGWSLSAGGGIFRQVRGLPDDYNGNPNDVTDLRRGWLCVVNGTTIGSQINAFTQSSDASLVTYTDEANDYAYLNSLAYIKDTEPDLYSFSAPGLSGSFVFGADGQPKLIPYQDVKITITAGLPISIFYITTNDGTKYTFSVKTQVTQIARHYKAGTGITQFRTQKNLYNPAPGYGYNQGVRFGTSWELGRIETPAGEKIDLTFMPDRTRNSTEYIAISSIATPEPDTTWYYDQEVTIPLLKKVESRARKIEFDWSGGDDLILVTVTDKTSSKVKNFNIYWTSVVGTDQPTVQTKRRLLTSVYESMSCSPFPAYTFEYYGVTNGTISIPFNNPKVKSDRWGYFNNIATNNNPTIYYYAGRSGSDRYRFYQIPGESYTARINGGSDRSVNENTIMYGSLKTINYPTGGQSEIIYEPNSYHDAAAGAAYYGPGIRVKQVITRDQVGNAPETVVDYEYELSDGKSSGKWTYRSAFAYHDVTKLYATSSRDNSPEPQVMYERVSVSQAGKGKVVTEFKLPGMDPLTSGSGEYSDWSAAKTYIARSGNIPAGELISDFYQMPFAPNIKYDFERGLVSKVSTINNTGATVHEKLYTYQRLATASVVVKGLRYELLKNASIDLDGTSPMYVFSFYPVLTNAGRVIFTETERVADMTDLTKWHETSTIYTFSNAHYMLSMMSVANSDSVQHRTKFRYAKDYAGLTQPSGSDVNSQMIKKLNDPVNFMHGVPVATISSTYKGTETNTGASVTLYGPSPDSLGLERILPEQTRVTNGMVGWTEPVVVPASGANQVLTMAGTYSTTSKVEKYDFIGTPLTVRTREKTLNAVHMGHSKSLPVATIANAAASEVVYDGFETYTGFGFNVVSHPPLPQFSYPAGWSGKKGLAMFPNASIERTDVSKGKGSFYRYSIRVNGGSNTNIYFRVFDGTTLKVTGTVNHNTGNNNWKYYEGRIDMTTVPSTFKLKVENDVAVTIDDVMFYPESSSISTFTYEPLFGKTSETDTRGSSIFYEYDNLGRISTLKDQDKTLRQRTDYYYKSQPYPQVKAEFVSSVDGLVAMNEQVTYTARATLDCLSGVTYDWYVDNVKLLDNSPTFQHTFTSIGIHAVKMVAEHISYGTASGHKDVTVVRASRSPLDVTATTSNLIYTNCDPHYRKTFTAQISGCYLPDDVVITWYYKLGGSIWSQLPGTIGTISPDDLSMEFDALIAFNGVSNLNDYQIKFEVTGRCPFDHGNDFGTMHLDSVEKQVDFQFNANCQ